MGDGRAVAASGTNGGRCGHTRRHRHRRHVHRPRRRRRVQRRLVRREGPLDARAAGGGARRGARAGEFDPADVSFIVVGTTIGINAVLTRTGARVLYLTTKGFEDVPHIQRINRKNHYDFVWRKPAPLARRRDCIGVDERIGRRGRGRQRARRRRGCATLLPERGDGEDVAVAVCFLFSYLNPDVRAGGARGAGRDRPRPPGLALARDRADLARVRARHGGDPRRLPQADASPLRRGVSEALRGPGRRLQVVAAEVQRRSRAGQRGAQAARPRAALGHRRRRDRRRLLRARARRRRAAIMLDMGGTSCDVCLIVDGEPAVLLGVRDRVRPPGRGADREHEDDRRRRRLDRLDRPRRLPPGRPAERGRRPGAGVLRPGRRRSRRSPTPTSCSAGSTPTTSSAATSSWTREAARAALAHGSATTRCRSRPR